MGTFEVGLNAFLHYDMAINLWGPRSKMWSFARKLPPQGVTIRMCDFVGGSMSLRGWTLGPPLLIYTQFGRQYTSCYLVDQDVEFSATFLVPCLHVCCHVLP